MAYLENNVISAKENIVLKANKNAIFLVLKWIWGVLGFWLLLIPTISAIKETHIKVRVICVPKIPLSVIYLVLNSLLK